jgi:hypothetical protein
MSHPLRGVCCLTASMPRGGIYLEASADSLLKLKVFNLPCAPGIDGVEVELRKIVRCFVFVSAPMGDENPTGLEITRQSGRGIHSPAGIEASECVACQSMAGEGTPAD